jgi:hypothetical protein
MQLTSGDVRTILDDYLGKSETLTGEALEEREAAERFALELVDDWTTSPAAENAKWRTSVTSLTASVRDSGRGRRYRHKACEIALCTVRWN